MFSTYTKLPIDLHARDDEGCTLLHHLCSKTESKEENEKNLVLLKSLFAETKKININITTHDELYDSNHKRSPLHFAAKTGFIEAIKLLHENKADIELADNENLTPAFLAAKEKKYEALKTLVQLDAKTANKNMSLFHIAAHEDDKTLCQLALEFKTSLETRDHDGRTPLLESMVYEKGLTFVEQSPELSDVFHMLLKAGANPEAVDKYGENILHYVVKKRYLLKLSNLIKTLSRETLKILLNKKNSAGLAPIHLFLSQVIDLRAHAWALELLIKAHQDSGVPVDIKNADGLSTLHYAICFTRGIRDYPENILSLLMEAGCNIYEKTKLPSSEVALTPLEHASQLECSDFAKRINKELKKPSHPANQKHLKHALLMGIHDKAKKDSTIYKFSRDTLFDKNVFNIVFDHLFAERSYFEKVSLDWSYKKISYKPGDFSIERVARHILISLGIDGEQLGYLKLSLIGQTFLEQFVLQWQVHALDSKKYVYFVLPTELHTIPVVIDLKLKEVYCIDPYLNQFNGQDRASQALNEIINIMPELCGFKLILPSEECDPLLNNLDPNNNAIITTMMVVGIILEKEKNKIWFQDLLANSIYLSTLINVKTGKGMINKEPYLDYYSSILFLANEDLQKKVKKPEFKLG